MEKMQLRCLSTWLMEVVEPTTARIHVMEANHENETQSFSLVSAFYALLHIASLLTWPVEVTYAEGNRRERPANSDIHMNVECCSILVIHVLAGVGMAGIGNLTQIVANGKCDSVCQVVEQCEENNSSRSFNKLSSRRLATGLWNLDFATAENLSGGIER